MSNNNNDNNNEKLGRGYHDFSTDVPNDLTNIEKVPSAKIVDCGFGHTTRDELLKDLNTDKVYDPRALKWLYKYGNYQDTISRHYAVIPDEPIEMIMKPFFDDGTFDKCIKEKTKNGLGTCWRLIANEEQFIIKQPVNNHDTKDDVYKVGIIVRNSVNGGIALGGNVDTYRQICSNGMMGWKNEMSLRLFHYGDVKKKLEAFKEFFGKALSLKDYIESTLQATTTIPATKELMQFLVTDTDLAKNWLPDWTFIDEKQYRVTGIRGTHTLYEAINDITWKLTRSRKDHPEHSLVNGELGFLQRNMFERNLGRSVEIIVKEKGGIPKSKKKTKF